MVQTHEVAAHRCIQDVFRRLSLEVSAHDGITHEIRGDALVTEFGRASDAVAAALVFQSGCDDQPDEGQGGIRATLRIGISLAEVVIADGTVTGPGVVVAQRLEQLADPGGVVVQGSVVETVPTRLPFAFDSLGEQSLKGFDHPVRAFIARVKPGEDLSMLHANSRNARSAAEAADSPDRDPAERTSRPSIAVLPFANKSGDPEQEYFSDGISEDLITELSRCRELVVIARNSSFAFKGQDADSLEIGGQLGVQYLVEGSVRKAGKRVRVSAQLIDARTGAHVWGERYDREQEDLFDVQDEVVRIVTSTLMGRVALAHRDRRQRTPTANLDAYDWFTRGREHFYQASPEDNGKAAHMFGKAISLDPDYAAAHALLSESYVRDWLTFWNEPLESSYDHAWEAGYRAMSLDDSDSRSQAAIGIAHLFSGNLDQARFHLDQALRLNPSDTHAMIYRARYDVFSGNPEAALKRMADALRYNPYGKYNWYLVPAYYAAGRYEDAIHMLNNIHNPTAIMRSWHAASYARIGDVDKASNATNRMISEASAMLGSDNLPASWLDFLVERYPAEPGSREHYAEGLRMSGLC